MRVSSALRKDVAHLADLHPLRFSLCHGQMWNLFKKSGTFITVFAFYNREVSVGKTRTYGWAFFKEGIFAPFSA
ncbi:hypothetical protein AS29_002550 [Bacillus sp. SJS]|nr:hypothetical protein AS29_002550 [Bacillus sp. SJS]